MPDEIKIGAATVEVKADTSKLSKGVNKAKGEVDSLKQSGVQAGAVFKGVFAVQALNAVLKFGRESIRAYIASEKALNRVVSTARKYGSATDDLTGKIGKYLQQVESTTRFSDTEAADTLNSMILYTKDLGTATSLTTMAMDFSERTGRSLNESMQLLGEAFTGDASKVRTLGEKLGFAGEKAGDAKIVFGELKGQIKGAASEATDMDKEMSKLGNTISNIGKDVVKASGIGEGMKRLAADLRASLETLRGDQDRSGEEHFLRESIKNVEILKESLKKMRDVGGGFSRPVLDQYARAEERLGRLKDRLKEITDLRQQDADKQADIAALAAENQRKLAEAEQLKIDAEKKKIQLAEEQKRKADEAQKALDRSISKYQAFGATLSSLTQNEMATFWGSVREGTATAGQAVGALGRSIAKTLIGALGDVLAQKSAAAFAEGAAMLVNPITAPGAPGFFAQGSLLAVGAGTIKGAAAALKDGGFTVGGETGRDTIPAMLRKNEAVVPLDDPVAMAKIQGLGGMKVEGGVHIQASFPGVRTASDAQGASESMALGIIKNLERVRNRRGNRGGSL